MPAALHLASDALGAGDGERDDGAEHAELVRLPEASVFEIGATRFGFGKEAFDLPAAAVEAGGAARVAIGGEHQALAFLIVFAASAKRCAVCGCMPSKRTPGTLSRRRQSRCENSSRRWYGGRRRAPRTGST